VNVFRYSVPGYFVHGRCCLCELYQIVTGFSVSKPTLGKYVLLLFPFSLSLRVGPGEVQRQLSVLV
jgi:hypothetical protein